MCRWDLCGISRGMAGWQRSGYIACQGPKADAVGAQRDTGPPPMLPKFKLHQKYTCYTVLYFVLSVFPAVQIPMHHVP